MSERDFSVRDPEYPPSVHPDTARECLEAWRAGRPWTDIRVLEPRDSTDGQQCANSQGHFNEACSKKIEAVQYTTRFGDPLFFCEEHALKQVEWEHIFAGPGNPEDHSLSPEEQRDLDRILNKGKKKKEPEPEEFDL